MFTYTGVDRSRFTVVCETGLILIFLFIIILFSIRTTVNSFLPTLYYNTLYPALLFGGAGAVLGVGKQGCEKPAE